MTHRRIVVAIAICALALSGCNDPKAAPESHATWRDVITSPKPVPREESAPSPTPPKPPTSPKKPAPRPRTGPHGSVITTGSDGVGLTFDDGPSPAWTPKVLALLRRARVKATFCLVGLEVQRHPGLVQAIVRDGHTLCNHSWDHDLRLGSRKPGEIKANLARTNRAILRAVPGARIGYYRQPGGVWTARAVGVARSMGMTPLHWSVDPQDWRKPPAHQISGTVLRHTRKGSVVLLHDGGGDRHTTYHALRTVLPQLTRRFRLVSL
ncbi:MAG: polysaccharide deacetylase family protein [Micromonosporaceae bacterium]